jgi:tetratricopeptide (TPR) repeat protein
MVKIAKTIEKTPTMDQIVKLRDEIPHLKEVANKWIKDLAKKDLIYIFVGIGNFYKGQGNYVFAEPWYRGSLDITRKILGEKHPDVSASLNNLGMLYSEQGCYEEAESFHKQSLAMQKFWKQKLQNVLPGLNNLAGVYVDQGRYGEAQLLYEKAMKINQRFCGEKIRLYFLPTL